MNVVIPYAINKYYYIILFLDRGIFFNLRCHFPALTIGSGFAAKKRRKINKYKLFCQALYFFYVSTIWSIYIDRSLISLETLSSWNLKKSVSYSDWESEWLIGWHLLWDHRSCHIWNCRHGSYDYNFTASKLSRSLCASLAGLNYCHFICVFITRILSCLMLLGWFELRLGK